MSCVTDEPGAAKRATAKLQEVTVGVAALRAELAVLRVRGPGGGVREPTRLRRLGVIRPKSVTRIRTPPEASALPEWIARCDGVQRLLDAAQRAAAGPRPLRHRLWSWWHGCCIESAFQNLHRAEAEIACLYDDLQIRAATPEAIARICGGLKIDDERRKAALRVLITDPGSTAERRLVLAKTIQIGHEVKDQQFTKIRKFRNIVILSAALSYLLTMGVGLAVTLKEPALPTYAVEFCFENAPAPRHCATGDRPYARDVWIVALMGILGGSLSAVTSIRKIRGTPSPYNLAIALAALKVPAGALSAIGGLLLLSGEFVPGFTALDSPSQILAYALVFGFAQQLVTGLADKRAHDLATSVPNKDVERARSAEPVPRW